VRASRARAAHSQALGGPPPIAQMTRESIKIIFVKLEVDGQPSLAVLLGDDGSVNRMGTGAVDNTEQALFIGVTDEPLFAQLHAMVRPEWLSHSGGYEIPNRAGRTCTLLVIFKASDGAELSLGFRYGSESQGPPADICQFVGEAVRLTDSWLEKQPSRRSEKPSKPAWKFW
jgi:hypothetical protein